MKEYKMRFADSLLRKKLEGSGAVLIEGAKWCGKTTTAEMAAGSVLYMSDPQTEKQNLTLADISPKTLLEGDTPRLIDEWQIAPKLWDAVRFEADHRDELGQFILTGSAVPASLDGVHHTGTGRISRLRMRPMTLFESGESTGDISLSELFSAFGEISGKSSLSLQDIAYLVCRGGWPRTVEMDEDIALEMAFDYYEAVVSSDINRADGVSKNPERVKRLMRSLARNQGTQASVASICADMMTNDTSSLDENTVSSYINALKMIFVIEDMPAWSPNLRSKTAIRTSDTRYFTDPSIATAALGLGPGDLIGDLHTFGFMFEAMCIRDLRVYAESLNGGVYHYRDKSGLECDAVIHLRNGAYGLAEIKLGGDRLVEEGAENLKALASVIDTEKMKFPSFMAVITGTGDYAYLRPDGVCVIPIGCLKN